MDDPLRRDIEATPQVKRVGGRLTDAPGLDCSSLSGYRAVCADETAGRAFVLTGSAQREQFLRLCREWEAFGDLPGITPVVARSDGSTPWIVVRHPNNSLQTADHSDISTELVVSRLAEALYRADAVHGVLTPSHVQFPPDGKPCLDWALGRLADSDSAEYLAPEVRTAEREPDARTDVYGLGVIAWQLLTGAAPDTDSDMPSVDMDSNSRIVTACRRALATDPAERHASAYEFKQELLFADAASHDRDELTGATPEQPSGRTETAADEIDETGGPLTRRQILGAGGVVAAGAVLGARSLQTATPVDSSDTAQFETTYESGLLVIRYTGQGSFDPSEITVSGQGIGAGISTELSWADFPPESAVEAGSMISLAADPAFQIDIETPSESATATGPAARQRSPDPERLPTPTLPFEFTHRGNAVRVNPEFDIPVRADHIELTASGGDQARRLRWHELAGTAPSRPLPAGGPLAYPAPETVVLSLVWAPPYFEDSRSLTRYTGPDRPRDSTVGGVRYPQYDRQNTGYEPSFSALSAPELAWETPLPAERVRFSSLAVADGRVLVSAKQQLYCLDAVDGEQLWETTADVNALFQPIVWNNLVFVGSTDAAGDAAAIAVDLSDGSIRWQFQQGYQVMWPPFPVGDHVVTGGTGVIDPRVYWLDPEDGSRQAVVPDRAQQARPATDGETLYLNDENGLYALTPTGVTWSFEQPVRGQPTLVEDSVFTVSNPRPDDSAVAVTELAAADGSVVWESESFSTQGVPALAATDETVFIRGERTVRALEPRGQSRWVVETGPITGGPVVAGDQLHVTTTDGQLHAIDRATGDERWTISYGNQLLTPAVVNDLIVLRQRSGPVAGFR